MRTDVDALVGAVQAEMPGWSRQPLRFECFASDREAARKAAQAWADINRARERTKVLSWDGVLTQQLFAALAASPSERVNALVQLAAASLAAATSEE